MSLLSGNVDDKGSGDAAATDATTVASGGNQGNQDNQGDGGSAGNPEWNEGIDESMRERMGKFKDVNGLAKSYIELEAKLGEGFKMPETDEEKAKLFAKLGRPVDAESYEFEGEDTLGFKAHAFNLGLSQDQAARHITWFKGVMEKHADGLDVTSKASEVKLREKWGDEYKDNLALADRALSGLYSEDLIDRLKLGGFLDDQEFVSHLYLQGKKAANDSIGAGGNLTEVERTEAGQPLLDFPSMKEYD